MGAENERMKVTTSQWFELWQFVTNIGFVARGSAFNLFFYDLLVAVQKLERLKATLHLTGQARPSQKTVFEDDDVRLRHPRLSSGTGLGRLSNEDSATDASDSDSDASAADLRENLPEASAAENLDDDTAARVSRCGIMTRV